MNLISRIFLIVACIGYQTEVCQCTKQKYSLCYYKVSDLVSYFCKAHPNISCEHGVIDVTDITILKQPAWCNMLIGCWDRCCKKAGGMLINKTIDVKKICDSRTCDFSTEMQAFPKTKWSYYTVTFQYQCKVHQDPEGSATTAVIVTVILVIVAMVTTKVVVFVVVTRRRRKTNGNGDSDNGVAVDFHPANITLPTAPMDTGDYTEIPDAAVAEYIARELESKVRTAKEMTEHTDGKSDHVGENNVYHYIDESMMTDGTDASPNVNGQESAMAMTALVASCLTEYDVVGQTQRTNEREPYSNDYDQVNHHARRDSDDENAGDIRRQRSTPMRDSTYSHVQHSTDERSVECSESSATGATGSELDDDINRNDVLVDPALKEEPQYFILSKTCK